MELKQTNGYSYNIEIPSFIYSMKDNNFLSLNVGTSISGSANINFRESVLGTIGEGFERQILYDATMTDSFTAFNLLKKNFEIIPVNAHTKTFFYDSCGLATHVTTNNSIENAFKEFVERQSFILSYLSKRKAKKVIKNEYFKMLIPSRFHKMNFFEISLAPSYRVFFCFGEINKSVAIGLGAGYTTEEAMKKLLGEISSFSLHGSIEPKTNDDIDYIHLFHMIPIKDIIKAYNYLDNSDEFFTPCENEAKKSMNWVLKELQLYWKMEPLCTFLINDHYNFSRYKYSKNIKFFDLNWFPSLNLNSYSDIIYNNVEKHSGYKLDRKTNFIPFP